VEFRILGPLEARVDGRRIALGGSKQRAVLGVLLLHANEVVAADRLVDDLWGERPPGTAGKVVQGYVSRLRKILGAPVLATRPPGYAVELDEDALDLLRFVRLLADARSERGSAAELLRAALELWRGPAALADLTLHGASALEVARLNELRLAALADRIDAELELGQTPGLIGELETLVTAHPYDERLRRLLMLALYHAGRQADALEAYGSARRMLVADLGIEPGTELQALERQILLHAPELDRPRTASPVLVTPPQSAAERETRRVVTVVFADVTASAVGGEPLDPESERGLTRQFFAEVQTVAEHHGGSVPELAGDTVMAVFGARTAHEDDALRGVRAAAAIRSAVAALNVELERRSVVIAARTGVATGQVLAAGNSVEGDAVRGARRLHEGAGAGEILLDAATFALVHGGVVAEPVEAGKSTTAFRLVDVIDGVPGFARRFDVPLFGRDAELGLLRAAYRDAAAATRCELATIMGEAGIGKTRLANELLTEVGDEARVLVGRCVQYGEGATFLPLAEMVDQLGGVDALPAGSVASGVAAALGRSEAAVSTDEIFVAVRAAVEHAARDRPLVLVFEDIHWAEPALLDLIEYLAGWAGEASILLLCLTRDSILESRPDWASKGRSIVLRPLPAAESEKLVDTLASELPAAVRARIAGTAEGNPLFLEQLVAFTLDGHDTEEMPPTIGALLAARLDRLPGPQRAVLERASVIGREFWRGAVAELSPPDERSSAGQELLALARAGVVHPDRGTLPGEDAFRFHHVLIRDAAYASVPKAERARLHEQFAGWLEQRAPDSDELIGYHLEQAFRLLGELGLPDDHTDELARRGGERLARAAAGASRRFDTGALRNLVPRALPLLAVVGVERPDLMLDLASGLFWSGDLAQTETVLEELSGAARDVGDARSGRLARLELAWLDVAKGRAGAAKTLRTAAEAARSAFEADGDDRGLSSAWYALGSVHMLECRIARAGDAYEHALVHCRRADDRLKEVEIVAALTSALVAGPVRVDEAIRRIDALRPSALMPCLAQLVPLEVMRGRLDEARALYAEAYALAEPLGHWTGIAQSKWSTALLELRAGDLVAAEAEARWGYDELVRAGVLSNVQGFAALLADLLYRQGRYDEADELATESAELATHEDLSGQWGWRAIRAKLLAQRGETGAALALAREAVELSRVTDMLSERGRLLLDLAEVLRLAGDDGGMRAAAGEATAMYELKGDLGGAAEARAVVASAA
jgi:DNA-binding SARP family transcriptional activator